MLLGSGYIPLLNFSFITKLINRPLPPPVNSVPSQPSGKEITSFQCIGELGSILLAIGCDLIESASSEGMSSGLQACSLEKQRAYKFTLSRKNVGAKLGEEDSAKSIVRLSPYFAS